MGGVVVFVGGRRDAVVVVGGRNGLRLGGRFVARGGMFVSF
jgi:hypothetical protein